MADHDVLAFCMRSGRCEPSGDAPRASVLTRTRCHRGLLAGILAIFVTILSLSCPAAIAELVIEGVSPRIERAIRASSSVGDTCELPAWLVRYRLQALTESTRGVLETFGHYSPTIDPQATVDEGCTQVTLRIDPGRPTLIETARVTVAGEGEGMVEFRKIIADAPVRPGQQLDHESYESLKTRLEETALRTGFFDARFSEHEILVDPVRFAADVMLTLDTGPRYHFGDVSFSTDALKPELLSRYVPFAAGDAYDAALMSRFGQQLRASGYFEDVSVLAGDPDAASKAVPVIANLEPGRHVSLEAGVGYSTDVGPSVTVERGNRLRNRSGHQTSINLSWAPVRSEISGDYRIPQGDHADGWLSVYGGVRRVDTDTFTANYTTLGIRRVVPRGGGWVETLFLEASNAEFDVADASGTALTVIPGINLAHTRTDDLTARPRRAHRISVEVSGSHDALGSSVDYLSIRFEGRIIRPLSERMRFIGRSRVGWTNTRDFADLPPRARFFSGGDSQVRGFSYQEIGAIDADGTVVGGNRLLEGSAEVDFLLTRSWAVAAFVDAASVTVAAFDSAFERSAGVGVRWYSPIGPLRFDVARPLNSGETARLHISFGPDV